MRSLREVAERSSTGRWHCLVRAAVRRAAPSLLRATPATRKLAGEGQGNGAGLAQLAVPDRRCVSSPDLGVAGPNTWSLSRSAVRAALTEQRFRFDRGVG